MSKPPTQRSGVDPERRLLGVPKASSWSHLRLMPPRGEGLRGMGLSERRVVKVLFVGEGEGQNE